MAVCLFPTQQQAIWFTVICVFWVVQLFTATSPVHIFSDGLMFISVLLGIKHVREFKLQVKRNIVIIRSDVLSEYKS